MMLENKEFKDFKNINKLALNNLRIYWNNFMIGETLLFLQLRKLFPQISKINKKI